MENTAINLCGSEPVVTPDFDYEKDQATIKKATCVAFSIVFSNPAKLHPEVLVPIGEMMVSMFNGFESFYYGGSPTHTSFDLLYKDSFTNKEKLIGVSFHIPKNRRKLVEVVQREIIKMFPVYAQVDEKDFENFPDIPEVTHFIGSKECDESVFIYETVWMFRCFNNVQPMKKRMSYPQIPLKALENVIRN